MKDLSVEDLITRLFNHVYGTEYLPGDELIVPDSAFEFTNGSAEKTEGSSSAGQALPE